MPARKKCPRSKIVQTLVLPKSDFTLGEALEWIVGHRFVAGDVRENRCQYRARQWPRKDFEESSLRKIRFGRSSIQAVVGCPNQKTSRAEKRRRKRLKAKEER